MALPETGGGLSLINLGELAKPATVLIEKISAAVGGIARPWQIKRIAVAAARADIIGAHARVQVSEIEARALRRLVKEEGRKQANIESITSKALPLLSADAKPENIEDDWIAHFFDQCRNVSDDDMQALWSRLLAGEANSPSSIGRRTVNLVSTFDKRDASLFTKLCDFVWTVGEPMPVVYDVDSQLMRGVGLGFTILTHLDNIGLITFNKVTGFQAEKLPKQICIAYHNRVFRLEFPNDENILQLGSVILTRAGSDLARICKGSPSDEYLMTVLTKWWSENIIITTLLQ